MFVRFILPFLLTFASKQLKKNSQAKKTGRKGASASRRRSHSRRR